MPPRPHTPIRVKATLVGLFGVMLGLALGLTQAGLGPSAWGLMLGLAAVTTVVSWLAQSWIARPVDRLVRQLELMARAPRPQMLCELPADRGDEIGRIAQSVRQIAIEAVRNHHLARQLRLSLDSRVAVETHHAVRQLRQLAVRDPLTDLGNRRFLDEHLDQLVKVSLAARSDLLCMIIDIDFFKEVNDRLGHQAGDDLLVMLAGLIKASVRSDDLCIRLGGDEFVVLLPGATPQRVETLSEGMRKLLRQQARVRFPGGPYPDLSIGIASLLKDHCDTGRQLLAIADARLYEAKRQGRGRTIGLNDQPVNLPLQPNLHLAV